MILGVTGKPIAHSLSPCLHQAGLSYCGLEGASVRIVADSALEAIDVAQKIGLQGLNITAPFKQEVWEHLASLDDVSISDVVRRTKAVNTLTLNARKRAENTDVDGVRACVLAAQSRRDRPILRALVLGAGGAARAAVCALHDLKIGPVVMNRDLEKAKLVVAELGGEFVEWPSECALRKIDISSFDLIVSTVPQSVMVEFLPSLTPGQVIIDAIYSGESATDGSPVREAGEASVAARCQARGIDYISGWEWLVQQGRAALDVFGCCGVSEEILRESRSRPTSSFGSVSPRTRSIALVGMMGCGKSTVGEQLAQITSLPYVDTDSEVERAAGQSIAQLFSDSATRFRQFEREVITELCERGRQIIACGGGAILHHENVAALKRNCSVVWLWADLEALVARTAETATRPLLLARGQSTQADRFQQRTQRLREILAERLPLYAAAADLVIDTTTRTPSEVARRLVDEIG